LASSTLSYLAFIPQRVDEDRQGYNVSDDPVQPSHRDVAQNTARGAEAVQWGMDPSLDGIPESSYPHVVMNVLFTQRTFANPGMLESNGASTSPGSPIRIPSDITQSAEAL